MPILSEIVRALENGANLSESELLALAAGPREDLFDTAEAVTRKMAPRAYNLCGIINVKSGECSENCRWCAQSKHWEVPGVKIHPILPDDKVEAGARRAAEAGIVRYSLVASGRKPSRREIREYCERIREVKRNHPELEVCVSLGLLSEEDLSALKDAGVVRIHCNLETSPEFFREVCTSHRIDDKIETLRRARALGLDVCSGGLIGMGETLLDRIRLARLCRELEVPSIPINLLYRVPGTPLADVEALSQEEFLVAAALFRLANPTAYLRFAGGRNLLTPDTIREAMRIGINSAISGDLLTTTSGGTPADDAALFQTAGYAAP
ncbi:biotin synthase BioB [uncultured Sutterella sp.]|uniref:biotin synthase BioB n=1 Tax=uncultured Sutterella sp. TaxID=286133 RepID=UPI00266CB2CE|nr:biotin synthase BioB [uncultured Sutterella sp.]